MADEGRGRPLLALAFTDGRAPRRYVTRRSAYYQIAKAAVVAKYPAWLEYDLDVNDSRGPQWTRELAELRYDKSVALFHHEGGGFDSRRWRHFIERVARFMMFVDARRSLEHDLRRRTTDELVKMWSTRERWLSELADEMTAIKRVVDERERDAGHR